MSRRAAAGLLFAGALLGCGARPASVPPTAGADGSLRITLERRPCYGTCPVYRLALTGSGTLSWEGVRFVQRVGTLEERIAPERVAALAQELSDAAFGELAERYVRGEPACGRYAADAPTVVMSLTRGGVTRTVEHDHGCAAAPRSLVTLQDRIDEVAESWRWTTGRRP
jgi:hypothetical protein